MAGQTVKDLIEKFNQQRALLHYSEQAKLAENDPTLQQKKTDEKVAEWVKEVFPLMK